MHKIALTGAALLAALTLAACSAGNPDTGKMPDTAPVSSSPSPSPTADESKDEYGERIISERGNLVKEVGQLAGVSLADDTVAARFAVTDIIVDPQCDEEYADAPANGHFVAIHLNVETTPELAQDEFPWVSFTEYDWQAFDAEGKRLNDPQGNAWSCLSASQRLPNQIGPGQSVSGFIVLDVASTTGTLMLALSGSPTGWEWEY